YRAILGSTTNRRSPVLLEVSAGHGPVVDATPPIISNVAVTSTSSFTTSTATVMWQTNEPASSLVKYGTTPGALDRTAQMLDSSTAHTMALAGLVPNTPYYYTVASTDGANNSATFPTGAPASFRTPAALSTTF